MTQTDQRDDLSIDQRLALYTSAKRLRSEFNGVFWLETIERFLHASYGQFAEHTTDRACLPKRAECFTRQRLQALARVNGTTHDTRPAVLFLGVHNTVRSPMALGFFRHYADDRAVGWSAGSKPCNSIDPAAIAAMQARDIDISRDFPKPWTHELVRAADVIVTMPGTEVHPEFPGNRCLEWKLDSDTTEPALRDTIERHVQELLAELGISGSQPPGPAPTSRSHAAAGP